MKKLLAAALVSLIFVAPAAAEQKHLFQLSYSDAEKAISDALSEKADSGKIVATINGQKNDPLFSHGNPLTVEIRGLTFDKTSGRWNASLMAVSEGDIVSAVPVAGRFEEVVEVPVLKRQVQGGSVISESDVEMRIFPVARTRAGTISSISDIVGKTPARTISPSRPIRDHELANPAVIKKNSIVKMRYAITGMEITATGQAMSDGAKGSLIAIRNLGSKKIVHALVEDASNVNVSPAEPKKEIQATSQTIGEQSHATN